MNLEVERLLDLASAVPASRRPALLAKECPDPELRAEVESLLQYATDAESYFERAIRGVATSVRTGDDPLPGDSFGAYRIVSLLGRGGMGTVYLAERADGEIQQKVAVKLLRADCFRTASRDRFLTERQLLASLQHPSIVHVMDAGHTDQGRPYLVMEYVEGVPIDAYASDIPDVRARLELFLRVCDGVAHAHRRLIIHRDLKPSNIIVDTAGHPKLLDFGIGRLLDDETGSVHTVDQLLTPSYASPEQLAGAAQSTATDIYSLGLVLYKLLTGVHARNTAKGGGDFAPPSQLNPAVPGDLDFIVGKALRREPEERYLSVDDLAADVSAALAWQPVRARSGDRWYRARRFLRRSWMPVAAGILVLTSLASGLYVANRERRIAERRFDEVRQLSNKLFEIDTQVAQLPGSSKTRQFIVDTALDYLHRAADGPADSHLALDLGTAYMRVARVQGVNISPNLGQTVKAEETAIRAEKLIEPVLEAEPGNRVALLRALQIAHDRMVLAGDQHHDSEALQFAAKCAARIERYLGMGAVSPKSDRRDNQQVILALINVANRYSIAGQFDEAIRLSRRAADTARSVAAQPQAGSALLIVAMAQRAKGELDAALESIRDAVRILEPPPGEKSTGRVMGYSLALVRESQILYDEDDVSLGRPADAAVLLERAFAVTKELAERDVTDFSVQYRAFNCKSKLAHIARHTDPRRAVELYDEALKYLLRLAGNSGTPKNEVMTLAASVYPLLALGRTAEAHRRLDAAFSRLTEQKLYPASKIELGGALDDTLRAQAEYEAATGNPRRGAEQFRELVNAIFAAQPEPADRLASAVELSNIYKASARIHRKAGEADAAAAFDGHRVQLWRAWSTKLPGNPFVAAQLSECP
ncbi:MAG TPA: protein kinase [Candidatus Solibacter sp.]|nr:protein kinase [Candidatus Solibacter sp.]